MWQFNKIEFHPVIHLPDSYPVFDFTAPEKSTSDAQYGIGRYNEKRQGLYEAEIFGGNRNIHIGVDIMAPVNTPVHSFSDGTIYLFGNNSSPGDYGFTLITEHRFSDRVLYALYGHLNGRSLEGKKTGQAIQKGEVIAWIGDRHENGGWVPHLHFQLSLEAPRSADMPGVVSETDHLEALCKYPDPRIVLGPIYL